MKTFLEIAEKFESMQRRLDALEKWKKLVCDHPELPGVMTASDIAKATHWSKTTAYRIMDSGKLRTFRFGSSKRTTREWFLEYMANGGDDGKDVESVGQDMDGMEHPV